MAAQGIVRWEYVTTPLVLHNEAAILNNWGDDGWELVHIGTGPAGGMVAFMKRPKLDAEDAA